MVLAQELLNSVYKVLGTVAQRNAEDPMETTPISSIKVVSETKRMVFHRSRSDMTWRLLDLTRIDFTPQSKASGRVAKVTTAGFNYVDATGELL
eukprot:gene29655-23570_t